ncbi:FAD-binding and (Fe-S)-binding domain-containing protein [Winogradskyella sp. UBA3174]|uniref:FAD-binding and (Fe-S)-binding domain-containing protein n=1 Tax=Winogradskyella sp. UBA3174 TaxID=1947785 RepID=UPI0025E08210|nr:FAD-binding and (Fe-S)-binding domain-containing protein [Winogradskyella sp. UBA3174]|tara:strand:- start:30418 stop:33345 length:2928 start_codon:yes stop_codon:yes gene_type:complete
MKHKKALEYLKKQFEGELYYDDLMRKLYATDASAYRKLPLAVALPKHKADLKLLIAFAKDEKTSLIPRTAGTSLAGQCVGDGIVVDVSKYFTRILDINETNKTVTVQPGVVRDELNNYLKPFGLFFGPNTSTSNRCMLGGMVGNNSSGSTSIQYGVTRDKVLSLKTILSDRSEAEFSNIKVEEFQEKLKLENLEGHIYKTIYNQLKSETIQKQIQDNFPKPEIHRRNTGYAIDALIKSEVFSDSNSSFNMCQLLSGSEGTLAFTTEITLKLDDLPPIESAMIAFHFESVSQCMKAVKPAMQYNLHTCEMIDDTILNLTKQNKTQEKNRQFIDGNPVAILMCELKADTSEALQIGIGNLLESVNKLNLSYAAPILKGKDIDKALELRKAGLGLLGNIIGDKKAVACIEDTAVALDDLEDYITEFTALMTSYQQKVVYYAHAGAGELHLRPILDLKQSEDVKLFREITTEVAKLVKKYKGSMSGEHGDGIVRGEFIPVMIGEENYKILKQIKSAFDPSNIFNPGKIVDAYPMDKSLRYEADRVEPKIETLLDFSSSQGILREAEKCNGSGDCRKLPEFGGTMCPSYRATRNEKDTTRARANALRDYLTNSEKANKFNHTELKEVFDLCLSCKACASECPSSVDVASLKAEFQYQYQKANGFKFKDKFFANSTRYNKLASRIPSLSNVLFNSKSISGFIKIFLGIHPNRSLPEITKSFTKIQTQIESSERTLVLDNPLKTVVLYVDEFTNYLESPIANDAKLLLESLDYKVLLVSHLESGRSFLSKGFLEEAKVLANKNIAYFKDALNDDFYLLGIEPSAILTFKDEYIKLADDKEVAKSIAKRTFLIEEFIQQEIELGNITSSKFTKEEKSLKFHGHCHQKALANQKSSFDMLNLPENYKVTIIPSGCCGMAGSFGYEKNHYNISMQIGEQTLFPAIRNASEDTIIAANGTSCRHQIKDGTGRLAKHPITILKEALV